MAAAPRAGLAVHTRAEAHAAPAISPAISTSASGMVAGAGARGGRFLSQLATNLARLPQSVASAAGTGVPAAAEPVPARPRIEEPLPEILQDVINEGRHASEDDAEDTPDCGRRDYKFLSLTVVRCWRHEKPQRGLVHECFRRRGPHTKPSHKH